MKLFSENFPTKTSILFSQEKVLNFFLLNSERYKNENSEKIKHPPNIKISRFTRSLFK
jgi:hypothetical protein